jgi:hypothetical protein
LSLNSYTSTTMNNQDGTTPSTEQGATNLSPLLRLAGELRNKIYQLALEGDAVEITSSGIPEPGLLLVNRQICKETLPFFYEDTCLEIPAPSYNPDICVKLTEKLRCKEQFAGQKFKIGYYWVHRTGPPSRSNVLRWLKHCH